MQNEIALSPFEYVLQHGDTKLSLILTSDSKNNIAGGLEGSFRVFYNSDALS